MPRSGEQLLTVLSNVRTSPKWSFKGRSEGRVSAGAPGPGAYQPGLDGRCSSPPKYGFGSSQRDAMKSSGYPGPGTYNLQDAAPGPHYSLRGRHQFGDRNFTPGPGTYQPGYMGHAPPQFGFGSGAQRGGLSAPQTPGPGTYSVNPQDGAPKWGMGSGARGWINRSTTPGPGTYNLGGTNEGPKWSVKGRYDPRTDNFVPGPGTYNRPSTVGDGPKYGFAGKGAYLAGAQGPGPGAYNPAVGQSRPSSPNWGFGTGNRDAMKASGYPGPGTYNLYDSTPGPHYSIRGRHALGDRNFTPGPGTYQPGYLGHAPPQFGFGSGAQRGGLSAPQTPGPGTYSLHDGVPGPKWGMGSGARGWTERSSTPGPGTYNLPSTNEGPAWTARGRYGQKGPEDGHIGLQITQFGY